LSIPNSLIAKGYGDKSLWKSLEGRVAPAHRIELAQKSDEGNKDARGVYGE
jgi:hypothetical protein